MSIKVWNKHSNNIDPHSFFESNALTDIAAYADGGIAPKDTWIIGVNEGKNDTQAINADYTAHYHNVVVNTPAVDCH